MVRALLYIRIITQIGIVVQLQHFKNFGVYFNFVPSLDLLKLAEIIVFTPMILILAYRTRQMRAYYLRHIHEDEEADGAKAKNS